MHLYTYTYTLYTQTSCHIYSEVCGKIAAETTSSMYKNSSGDEIANVNFFYNIAHVEASAYAH